MPDMLRVFKSLSDRTRLRIVRLLLDRDLCVCELMFVLNMAQSRVSHQLRILRDAGLVEDVRDGQWIIYRIPPEIRATLIPLLGLFDTKEEPSVRDSSDQRRLDSCLKEGIRKKKCSPIRKAPAPAGKRTLGKNS